ncbi:membrane protein UL124 [Human betaherpesvirus 5]|uniref:Membrane protein UL124 n=1 Tax=Human cytomegalovirus TaxID=10359 RepID=V9LN56_HCMV|nr:membrane protein UL124 [Human betaherpesvirus 5]AFR56436.1 membrane protein UL124 [Human betaherpesvirus 5]AKI21538.1 membrane protein UL124 [Human betaherpesvirus 5]APA46314.1 membrane protein UL124 [Human betaherpesvirus 5]APG57644.1 membrane protein UL124 [Human betaherpesvirus 5]
MERNSLLVCQLLCLVARAAATSTAQTTLPSTVNSTATGVTSDSYQNTTTQLPASSSAAALSLPNASAVQARSPRSFSDTYPTATALCGTLVVVGIVLCLSLASTVRSKELPSDHEPLEAWEQGSDVEAPPLPEKSPCPEHVPEIRVEIPRYV